LGYCNGISSICKTWISLYQLTLPITLTIKQEQMYSFYQQGTLHTSNKCLQISITSRNFITSPS
jgi:hypothetical protein